MMQHSYAAHLEPLQLDVAHAAAKLDETALRPHHAVWAVLLLPQARPDMLTVGSSAQCRLKKKFDHMPNQQQKG